MSATINRDFYDMMPAEADAIRADRFIVHTGNGAYYVTGESAALTRGAELATLYGFAQVVRDSDGAILETFK
ncbi:hypothetical protein FHT44_005100 [Mycolicibacterium sp. BK634]|uniref:hypothetical protein n=1 Tax=Mycolicibacterium sp. BK634 TaxID=2587099 RepID=UPI0016171930|nr:hypothetical protein [Mycolicibacterium sp. BK634]MBB3752588.1 hypothetical protein [Mycolicibacterium sp. BK634]